MVLNCSKFFILNGGTIECGLDAPQTKPKTSTKPYQGQADVGKVILFVRWKPVSAPTIVWNTREWSMFHIHKAYLSLCKSQYYS